MKDLLDGRSNARRANIDSLLIGSITRVWSTNIKAKLEKARSRTKTVKQFKINKGEFQSTIRQEDRDNISLYYLFKVDKEKKTTYWVNKEGKIKDIYLSKISNYPLVFGCDVRGYGDWLKKIKLIIKRKRLDK